jgi:hypothetical protein
MLVALLMELRKMATRKKILDNPALQAIRNERGLAKKIGDKIGISRSGVWMWKRVPPIHAVAVARLLKMQVHDVCPEIFPPPKRARKEHDATQA